MRLRQLFESSTILYHGDDFNTTWLNPEYMFHTNSNNQEGLGIYFSPDINVARSYGKNIVTIDIDGYNIVESRRLAVDIIDDFDAVQFLQFINDNDEDFWYLLTDYGIEVAESNEVEDYHLSELYSKMKTEEIRNFQIEIAQATNIELFIFAWNKYIKIDGLYERQSKFYSITNTEIRVIPLNRK